MPAAARQGVLGCAALVYSEMFFVASPMISNFLRTALSVLSSFTYQIFEDLRLDSGFDTHIRYNIRFDAKFVLQEIL
jgi:hypothetical protein